MKTEIKYLQDLERDLTRAAALTERTRGDRRRTLVSNIARAAAIVAVLAFGVGIVSTTFLGESASDKFDEVADAIGGSGGSAGDGVSAPQPIAGGTGTATSAPSPAPGNQAPDLSKIVRDGSISVAVDDGAFGDVFDRVVAIAQANRGFVLSSKTRGANSGTLTLRIPANRFDRAFVAVGALGEILESNVNGRDVTAEYVDLQARRTILDARRQVLLGLMEGATTIEQTPTLQRQLDDVQLKIEQIEGQLRFLDDQVAESTLKVDITERDESGGLPLVEDDAIENPSLRRAWARGVQGFLGVVAAVVVGLGYLLPVLAVVGVVYAVLMLARRRGHAAIPGPEPARR
jgi:hypothetical protein